MRPPSGDSNVGFTLTSIQRRQVGLLLERVVEELPNASSLLIDKAGRIVEVAQKPMGVNLPAISALAAGCYATTHGLAEAMGESDYSLLFQHENDQQVFIQPVAGRALLVVLLHAASAVDTVEHRLGNGLGTDLAKVVTEAQEPERRVPPPRVILADIPPEVRQKTRALTALIMDLQARRTEDFTPRVTQGLLTARDLLVQILGRQEWDKAAEACENTRQWLLREMYASAKVDVGLILQKLYREVFENMHRLLQGHVPPSRLHGLYQAFYKVFNKKWPRVYGAAWELSERGIDVEAMWARARAQCGEVQVAAEEFVPAMDALVHELLRVQFLAKGADGRLEALGSATDTLKKHTESLVQFGLSDVVGRDWVLTAPVQR